MKTKHLFIAMALPALFAACSQDEFVNENKFNDVPKLAADFKLTAEKFIDDAQTRGVWVSGPEGYEYKWDIKNNDDEVLGLCWTGKVGETAYTDQAFKKLFTNYKFDIYQASDDLDEEGALSGDIKGVGDDVEPLKYATFTTEASSLFAGEYIVYYPYNDSFNEIGNIKATVSDNFDAGSADIEDQYKAAGKEMFLMSGRTPMEGGQTTELFKLGVKSTVLDLRLKMAASETAVTVDKIILFDNTGLASEMLFDADGNVVEGSVKYDYKTISAAYDQGAEVAASTVEQGTSFVIPMLTVDLKATTVIYLHKKDGQWAKKAFTSPYAMKNGIMPLSISGLKVADFNLDLVTNADELKDKIEADAETIDILTDITIDNTFNSTWNQNNAIAITSATGAKLIFDVKDGDISFGGTNNINLGCDVEVKDSGATASGNTFTLVCSSVISGVFANSVETTFNEDVTIAEEGSVDNAGTLTLTANKALTVLGGVNNAADAEIEVPENATFDVQGRNAAIVNEGTLTNNGSMSIVKYNTNSVLNNGTAVVGVTGQFVGDFDATSTGTFWKNVSTIETLEEALTKGYSRVILASGTFDFSAAQKATILEAGDKEIEFAGTAAAITLPNADGEKNFTLTTTGKVIVNKDLTLGKAVAATAPVVTINAGELEAGANLTVNATGVLNIAGDINASSATVTFESGSTVNFDNYNNKGGASLVLKNGANVTYTGSINLVPN